MQQKEFRILNWIKKLLESGKIKIVRYNKVTCLRLEAQRKGMELPEYGDSEKVPCRIETQISEKGSCSCS